MEAGALPRPGRPVTPRSRRLLAAFSDERLVEHVRRGNEAAFEVVYDRHSRGILSFCRHMLGSADEAEDAVQHTFIAAYNDLLASDRAIRLKAWLYTIARNRCLSVLRARREHAVEEVEVSTAGLAEQVQERHDLRELLADMRELPDDQRAALVLAELGDLSHSDIAQVLGVEPVKVKSIVFQARSTLIELRDAREIPCEEIREQLSTLRGGALRRGPLRKHVKACQGCSEFRDEVRRQRTMMAAVLPVVPTLGLKHSALAAAGLGGGAAAGGGAVAGSAGLGGALSGLGSASVAAKAAVVLALGGAAVGGGVAIDQGTNGTPAQGPASSAGQGPVHRSAGGSGAALDPHGTATSAMPALPPMPAVPGLTREKTKQPRGAPGRVDPASPGAAVNEHGNGQANAPGQTGSNGNPHVDGAKPGNGNPQPGATGNGSANSNTNGNSSSGSTGTKPTHTPPGHSKPPKQHPGKGSASADAPATDSTASTATTDTPTTTDATTTSDATDPPAPVVHGNGHAKHPKPPKDPAATTATTTP